MSDTALKKKVASCIISATVIKAADIILLHPRRARKKYTVVRKHVTNLCVTSCWAWNITDDMLSRMISAWTDSLPAPRNICTITRIQPIPVRGSIDPRQGYHDLCHKRSQLRGLSGSSATTCTRREEVKASDELKSAIAGLLQVPRARAVLRALCTR
jgi:hypothetical protein